MGKDLFTVCVYLESQFGTGQWDLLNHSGAKISRDKENYFLGSLAGAERVARSHADNYASIKKPDTKKCDWRYELLKIDDDGGLVPKKVFSTSGGVFHEVGKCVGMQCPEVFVVGSYFTANEGKTMEEIQPSFREGDTRSTMLFLAKEPGLTPFPENPLFKGSLDSAIELIRGHFAHSGHIEDINYGIFKFSGGDIEECSKQEPIIRFSSEVVGEDDGLGRPLRTLMKHIN